MAQALGQAVTSDATAVQLHVARGSLEQASVFGRAAGRNEDRALAAFPLAPPLDPRPPLPTDTTRAVLGHLADDCERLSRAAFEALHGRGERRLSGSDLRQMGRWRAMGTLLAGQTLLHVAAHSDPETAVALQDTAGRLRGAAQAWQQSAAGWHRIVDLADPRAHPKLPLPAYDLVRSGQFAPMPKTSAHPALVTAQASATRVGQLLYGASWQPEGGKPPKPRTVEAILDDAGGVGALTATLYRLPATGWQLAAAAPVALSRARGGLVTDFMEHRPVGLDHRMRWYPAHGRQLDALTDAYSMIMDAEQAAAGALLQAARKAGTAVPRALLDVAAHRLIATQQGWEQTVAPAVPAAPPTRISPPTIHGARRRGISH